LSGALVSGPATVLIGANGQLGSDIVRAWPAGRLIALTRAELNVTDRAQVFDALGAHRPDLVINTTAFHNVDLCESEPDRAFAVNASGAMNVADACSSVGAELMFISTDYVYSGTADRAYTEADQPSPVNVYGVSKAAGEQLVRTRLARHYIVRTSGLYGVAGASGKGGNFVERMLQLAAEGRELRVVHDQVLSPTYTDDLAQKLLEIAQAGRYGTYHVTNSEACSWYEFAHAIFELAEVEAKLSPTTTAEFGAKAHRPAYSVLANTALPRVGLSLLRPWRQALADYLSVKGHIRSTEQVSGGIT
jgi:dTDP-4-dehydrorhamnose reductase